MIRDRTKLFEQFRKGYEYELNLSLDDYELQEINNNTMNTQKYKKSFNKEYVSLDMDNGQLDWLNIKEQIQENIKQVEDELKNLKILHKKRLMPGFTDRSNEEKAILELSELITTKLRKCHHLLQTLTRASKTNDKSSLVVKNSTISLAIHLQNLSNQFQAFQKEYVNKLRQREGGIGNKEGSSTNLINFNEDSNMEDEYSFQLVEQEVVISENEERIIMERESEIDKITQSISELGELFRSLQSMVIDQGTLLDRIDYNVEQIATNIKEANEELNIVSCFMKINIFF
ncbi:t-SNARE [Neoconidiobolus thromboides FSU 785]|nr:t-SNARE [Neoconidiobolus thromboides FSU 785]